MLTVSETAELLRSFDRVLILTHIRPDGDTVGCAAGLCAALRALGKTAFLLPNPGLTDTTAPYFAPYAAPAELYAGKGGVRGHCRGGAVPRQRQALYRRRVDLAIDHHPSFEGFGKANIVRPEAAACGELILDIIRELTPVTPEIALPLYVAISTDTGGFIYSNVTAATHRAAAELMDDRHRLPQGQQAVFPDQIPRADAAGSRHAGGCEILRRQPGGGSRRSPRPAGKVPRHRERRRGSFRPRPPDSGGGLRRDHAGAGRRRVEILAPHRGAGQRHGGLPPAGRRRPRAGCRCHRGTRDAGGSRGKNALRHRGRSCPDFKK